MSSIAKSVIDIFKRPTKSTVSGVVARFGADFRPAQIAGYVLTLQGDTKVYRLLRDDQTMTTPIGLTAPGDRVTFEADDKGEVVFSSFHNESLANLQIMV